ncbi:hypothetical protein EVAR_736_1 [Eumeta japonica]|uniref:Uncharacterized protein n=1 Tax=Eumeta variegata TaxID=151549 RepID=A0A4C1SEK4_EUMVA|nr:hypothetical protein EVAR_736_1 [Eumeta japonica]
MVTLAMDNLNPCALPVYIQGKEYILLRKNVYSFVDSLEIPTVDSRSFPMWQKNAHEAYDDGTSTIKMVIMGWSTPERSFRNPAPSQKSTYKELALDNVVKNQNDTYKVCKQRYNAFGDASISSSGVRVAIVLKSKDKDKESVENCLRREKNLLKQYGREVAASAVAFHPVSERFEGPLPLSSSIKPLHSLDIIFPPKRPATRCHPDLTRAGAGARSCLEVWKAGGSRAAVATSGEGKCDTYVSPPGDTRPASQTHLSGGAFVGPVFWDKVAVIVERTVVSEDAGWRYERPTAPTRYSPQKKLLRELSVHRPK